MAKEKKSVADLDAELAALEAELAALEGKAKAKPAAKASTPAAAEKKPRFGLPKMGKDPAPATAPPAASEPKAKRAFGFGRKKDAPEPQAAPPVELPAAAPPPPAREPQPAYDINAWRHEEGAWVRTTGRGQPVVRRILDEDDKLVREEAASLSDIEKNDDVKAERGARRLFGRK